MKIKKAARPIGHIHLERMSIEQLKPADYNPRTMTDRARTGLSNSIESFGLVQPIIYNKRTDHVVGGHQRLYDIIIKGATETDVVVVDLPEIKEKALNIALNHKGIAGDMDQEKLDALLLEVGQDAAGYIDRFNFDELMGDILDELPPDNEPVIDKPPTLTITIKNPALVEEMRVFISEALAEQYSHVDFEVK